MTNFLAHPLVVLLVGAVVTGLLIPSLLRISRDRQKELELKTELVSEISESIMQMVTDIEFFHMNPEPPRQKDKPSDLKQELDEAHRKWRVRSAVIGTKLESYFPQTEIPSNWGTSVETIQRLYELKGEDWEHLKESILKMKAKLIEDVLKCPVLVFRPSWAFWLRKDCQESSERGA
jgi:hypothetical protein